MELNHSLPTYAAFGICWAFDPYTRQIYVLIAESQNSCHGFPFGFPGGKQSHEDGSDMVKTVEREFKEETRLLIELPVPTWRVFTKNRRNDDAGNGAPFRNYFLGFQVADRMEFKPEPAMKDTVKEVKWYSLQDAERLPLKNDHRLALIELCYQLEENLKVEMKDALMALTFKMFHRPGDIHQNVLIKPEHQASITQILPERILPKEAFRYAYAA